MSFWEAFRCGAAIGTGISLIRLGVDGLIGIAKWPEPDPVATFQMAVRDMAPSPPPIESKMLVITAKRKRKLAEVSDSDTEQSPKEKPKVMPINDITRTKSDSSSSSDDSDIDLDVPEIPAPKPPVLKSRKNGPFRKPRLVPKSKAVAK